MNYRISDEFPVNVAHGNYIYESILITIENKKGFGWSHQMEM